VFQTSDCRSRDFARLGSHVTWVKWAKPTAEALRQACLARHSRVFSRRAETTFNPSHPHRGFETRRKDLGDGSTQQKASSGRLFTPPGGCSPRCAGVLRSPRKRQHLQRRLTPLVPTRESAFSPIAKKAAKGNRKFYGGKDSRLLRRPGVAEMTSRELLKELLKAPGREPQPVHPAADAQAADGAAGPIERVMDHWTESVSRSTGGTSARCKLYAFALVDCHRKGSKRQRQKAT